MFYGPRSESVSRTSEDGAASERRRTRGFSSFAFGILASLRMRISLGRGHEEEEGPFRGLCGDWPLSWSQALHASSVFFFYYYYCVGGAVHTCSKKEETQHAFVFPLVFPFPCLRCDRVCIRVLQVLTLFVSSRSSRIRGTIYCLFWFTFLFSLSLFFFSRE